MKIQHVEYGLSTELLQWLGSPCDKCGHSAHSEASAMWCASLTQEAIDRFHALRDFHLAVQDAQELDTVA